MSNLNDNFASLFKHSFGKNWMPVPRGVYSKEYILILPARVHSNYLVHELLLDVSKSIKRAEVDNFLK